MNDRDIVFEESLSDVWDEERHDVTEVPLDDRPLLQVGLVIAACGLIVLGQILYLNVIKRGFYVPRAEANLSSAESVPAPRGLVTDRFGTVIAENRAVFSALLDVRQFLKDKTTQQPTLDTIQNILGLAPDAVWELIHQYDLERSAEPIVLASNVDQSTVVALRDAKLSTLKIEDAFERSYPDGKMFSTLLGYVGLATKNDLSKSADLTSRDFVGKTGLEAYYDTALRGTAGTHVVLRDAKGNLLGEQDKKLPQGGPTLKLTIDAEFQKYFYERFEAALHKLGRTAGAGLAIDPRNGEILALFSFPSFDNNVFVTSGKTDERNAILKDPGLPLFDRAVAGTYSPGSTIKPLVGVAALAENIISPQRTIFSPGYLDVANPYNPSNPSRFLDWRYQGDVDLAAAIAQSSDVYFYEVAGGVPGLKGLGLDKLHSWWERFGLGKKTGVDLPGETAGFLPTAEWKKEATGQPWYLGDTYHVSIGQGDLIVTPLQLLSYTGAIANGGIIYAPHVNSTVSTKVNADLTEYKSEITEVQKGMRLTVTGSLGTAHTLNDLPFPSSGKSGSAQVKNNAEENAFYVAYAPSENPEIALMVLVENAQEGSLNAIPIAKEALNWYYEHRIKK